MTKETFILNIIKKVESLREGLIAYGYLTGNGPMTFTYWEIAVSDYEFYMKDKRFKALCKAWYQAAKSRGFTLVFVCGWIPKEKVLLELAEKDNLILNV